MTAIPKVGNTSFNAAAFVSHAVPRRWQLASVLIVSFVQSGPEVAATRVVGTSGMSMLRLD